MTVNELIEQLKGVPGDSIVVIPGYEGGYDNPQVTTGTMVPDTNWTGEDKESWYMGRHNVYYPDLDNGNKQPVNCVVVGRGK